MLVGQRRAQRHIIQRVFRTDPFCIERFVKAGAKLTQKGQRPAEIGDFPLQRPSLRQPRDRLVDDRAENARADVVFRRALIDERLDVAFGKHAAARGDGVGLPARLGEIIHLVGRDAQQRGHLVDERARTARAGAVHPHLRVLAQKQDFRVLAAQLDDDVAVGQVMSNRRARRIYLLHEGQAKRLRDAHARRAGHDEFAFPLVRERGRNLAQHSRRVLRDAREMAAVVLIQQLAARVQDYALERGRADIQTDSDHKAVPISFSLKRFRAKNDRNRIALRKRNLPIIILT